MSYYNKLASAIYNEVVSGLRGYSSTPNMSIEQIEDEIIQERLQIIKEYSMKGLIPKNDLLLSINCIKVDCKNIESCCNSTDGTSTYHFEIPQLLTEFDGGIEYIGSTDKANPFIYYTNPSVMKYHKFRGRAKNRPYVYINVTPNQNNLYDCFIFNIPLIKEVTVIGVFKDPRQLKNFDCNCSNNISNLSFVDTEIMKRLVEKKIRYYRSLATPITPNNQEPK